MKARERHYDRIVRTICALCFFAGAFVIFPAQIAAAGEVKISGELRQWHKVTLTLSGPFARELDNNPNPFTDYRFNVIFEHASGAPRYRVPGYFAADGDAANTSATEGNKWRAHLSPDKPGTWRYQIEFKKGKNAAINDDAAVEPVDGCDGLKGEFNIEPTDKTGRDFRAHGRLQYVNKHHLQFGGSGVYFLKAGADAPENLLAYADFDGTYSHKRRQARAGEAAPAKLKTWAPHLRDWRPGDPTWKNGKGKGLIGALNYLAGQGANAFSFLTYNAGGDGDDVWPFVTREDKLHYDCSKLDQWQVVFDHAQTLGLYLHFKMQETENDDSFLNGKTVVIPEALDGGDLGVERKLYCRELIARFGHELALNWNLGEENTQTPAQQTAMAQFIHDTDPYHHHIVIHTYPDWQDRVYSKLLGDRSVLTGASLQNPWNQVHARTLKWVRESERAGRPWVVANDEQNPASLGVPPDEGYQGFDGKAVEKDKPAYTLHDIRKFTLWGNLMAGGAGVEYYFGYKLPQNDLVCEDWRSREKSWNYAKIALEFFQTERIPFWEMQNMDALVGNEKNDNSRYCFAKRGELYLVYLPNGVRDGDVELDLAGVTGRLNVMWFNPRAGGPLQFGTVRVINAGGKVVLGRPPSDPEEDWLAVIRR